MARGELVRSMLEREGNEGNEGGELGLRGRTNALFGFGLGRESILGRGLTSMFIENATKNFGFVSCSSSVVS